MKRCKKAFILLTASLFLAVCVPVESKAEEEQDKACVEQENQIEMSLEEMFTDTVCTFETVIEMLYKEKGTVEALQNLEKRVQKDFYDKIGQDNQYKFTLFYKYTLLSAGINGKEEWNTAEELDEALKCYEMLAVWHGEKNVTEKEQVEDQFRVWEEDNPDKGFQFYVEYLQTMAEFDVKEFLSLLDGIEGASNEGDRTRASEEVKKYIYNLYGFEIVTGENTEEKEIINEERSVKEEEVTENAREEPGKNIPGIMTMAAAEVQAVYKPYCQAYGWEDWVSSGAEAGSPGERKRIEALQIKVTGGKDIGITYQAYVQGKGWINWANDGGTSGTAGQGLRLEAFRAKLTGANTAGYDVYYRAYCEGYGWLGWAKNGQTAGTVHLSKTMYSFQVVVVPAGLPAPGPTSNPLQTDAVARVGSTYYTTFDGAFSAVPDGGTMYVIRNCTAGHNVTTKSFTIYPEEQNVVITANSNLGEEPAGIIAAPQSTPEDKTGTWTLSGMDGYTLTIDGNGKCSSGILASSCKITMNLKTGVRLRNGITNGIWNGWGTTNVYDDVIIYGNRHAGITTWGGTVNIYGGDIHSNSITGVRGRIIHMSGGKVHHNGYVGIEAQGAVSNTAITITGGSIYSNAVDGVTAYAANGVCTTNISGGEIYSNNSAGVRSAAPSGTLILSNHPRIFKNEIGIVTEAATTLSGGMVYENRAGGIRTSKSFTISGGAIHSNKTGENGGGIYNSGILTVSGGEVYSNSAVFGGGIYNLGTLSVTGGSISRNSSTLGRGVYQGGIMNMSGGACIDGSNDIYLPETRNMVTVTGALTSGRTAALITPSSYILGRTCVRAAYKGAKGSEVYQKFALTPNSPYLLRPGDYQSEGGVTADTDAVISRDYPIYYKKNYNDDTIQVPKDSNKFWYESARISGQIPSFGSIEFKGWAENPDAKEAKYQPGDTIHAANNKGTTLYAVWKTEIRVAYIGNDADSGHPRSEYVTLKQCRENNGYEIKKNTGYTNFSRKGYAFAGWGNNKSKTNIKDVRYPENQKNKITFEELYQTAKEQQKNTAGGSAIPEAELYSIWDEAPKISADDNLEFYEGTEVTKKILLSNIKAFDKEDGDITRNVRIIRIKYADGRRMDGERRKGTVDIWERDMPEEYKLDTWFLQLDKEESPAVHKITYAVTDSAGTETILEWEVKIKYNEFPVIEAADWYFTLEEAQDGVITEDVLVKSALENGRLKVEDQEDDVLYPGTILQKVKLADFHPGEFTEFKESGYIVLTYSVQDSMGPEGEGKETLFQVTVHVVEDGEIIKPEPAKYVRFINKENYEKNVGIETEDLESAEKERLNQNGGLNIDSKWYQNSIYRSLISSMWSEEKTPDKVWHFSCEDVQKVKEYINIYGIGNSQEESALDKFLEKFPFFMQK
ncbi:hypothetical protein [Faecalicatena contorta]|uniref:Uncharacterized conserved protein YjdB, contains Ig-like domain n=1 Tax=Faecalicatena contorta TaxID=39482 RepID=A0A316A434_9FIRM|nr:hypothetical protein [Faecalicatena contorta]PWJ52435.1 uncharacterized protein YjdB [Faecalicatena contorta]SUQ12713.1 Uncharacterized conserved protein YjdB, contains Ig-like domain [Faecalicatena contorta]